MINSGTKSLRDSTAARWVVLMLLAFAMFCSYIFMDILSPIKDLMQSTRGWDSTAFGTMQGSETFLNVFVFFLIIAGIILDKMGVRFTAILSGAVMLIGATINWYAVTESFQGSGLEVWFTEHLNYIPGFDELGISPFYRGMPASAKFAAVGFMIFGCGVEMAGITGYLYDIFACICQVGRQYRRVPFSGFWRCSVDDIPDYVHNLFFYGQET